MFTDVSKQYSIYGLHDPEDEGKNIFRNVGKYHSTKSNDPDELNLQ